MTPNAMRINEINARLQTLRTNRNNEILARKKVRERLEDLRSANFKLDDLLGRYFDFPDDYCHLHTPVEQLSFRGSRREAIETRLNSICTSLKTQRERHEEHSQTLKNRIKSDESLENRHNATISSINSQISNLEAERRRLQIMDSN